VDRHSSPAVAEPHTPSLLVAYLADRDAPCPVCSYNLRGLADAAGSAPVCPECASELHLEVGSENLRLGAWLLAVISLALALGFDGVVTILLTIVLIVAGRPPSPAEFQIVITVLSCFVLLAGAAGGGIALLVRRRRGWLRMPPKRQWQVGAAVFLFTGLSHALYGWIVTRYL
jgi:hypothetical protein